MKIFNCSKKDLGQELIDDLSDIKSNYFDKGGYFFVAVLDNKIIGTVAIRPYKKGVAKLKRMYVNNKHHGKGIGSKLYDIAEAWCKKQGYKRIRLSIYTNLKKAIILYKHKGYKQFKKNKDNLLFYKNI
jgi:putative acetyltransferase